MCILQLSIITIIKFNILKYIECDKQHESATEFNQQAVFRSIIIEQSCLS